MVPGEQLGIDRGKMDGSLERDFTPAAALRWQGAPLMRRDILAASLAVNLFALALPLLILQVYDRILPNQSHSTLLMLVIGVSVVLVLDVAVRSARAQLSGWFGARFEHSVGVTGVKRLLEAGREDLDRDPPGRQLDRLAGVDMIRDFYASQASIAIVDLPFVILFLGLFAYIGGSLVLLPLTLLVIFSWTAIRFGERLHRAIENRTVWDDRRYNFIIENLSGIHTIKSMSMERLMMRRYERLMASCAEAGMKVTYYSGLAQSLGNSFSQISMAAVVGIGSLYVINNQLSIGGLAACTLLAGRAIQPVLRALGLWTRFQSIRVAEEKLAELERFRPQVPIGATQRTPIRSVELRKAYYRYEDVGPFVLKDISLKLETGEIVGIQGNNGSGKSTLLRLLGGSILPVKGGLYVNGEKASSDNAAIRQTEIAYISQRPVLFDGTVMENIRMFAQDGDLDEAMRIARFLDLDKVFAAYPEGFDTKVGGRGGANLPGGIGQRVSIARALLRRPSLILFDEANTALDASADRLVRETLLRLRDHAAIALVTYRPSLMAIADRRYVIEDCTLRPTDNNRGAANATAARTGAAATRKVAS